VWGTTHTGLADLYIKSGELGKCTELLRQNLEHHNHDYLHTKLGEVYTLTEAYSEALACFHTAISINPACTAAATGLDRLEKLMRGQDPDEQEDMDGVSGDAEGL
jgi:anaphase-promoting complex subunit 7